MFASLYSVAETGDLDSLFIAVVFQILGYLSLLRSAVELYLG